MGGKGPFPATGTARPVGQPENHRWLLRFVRIKRNAIDGFLLPLFSILLVYIQLDVISRARTRQELNLRLGLRHANGTLAEPFSTLASPQQFTNFLENDLATKLFLHNSLAGGPAATDLAAQAMQRQQRIQAMRSNSTSSYAVEGPSRLEAVQKVMVDPATLVTQLIGPLKLSYADQCQIIRPDYAAFLSAVQMLRGQHVSTDIALEFTFINLDSDVVALYALSATTDPLGTFQTRLDVRTLKLVSEDQRGSENVTRVELGFVGGCILFLLTEVILFCIYARWELRKARHADSRSRRALRCILALPFSWLRYIRATSIDAVIFYLGISMKVFYFILFAFSQRIPPVLARLSSSGEEIDILSSYCRLFSAYESLAAVVATVECLRGAWLLVGLAPRYRKVLKVGKAATPRVAAVFATAFLIVISLVFASGIAAASSWQLALTALYFIVGSELLTSALRGESSLFILFAHLLVQFFLYALVMNIIIVVLRREWAHRPDKHREARDARLSPHFLAAPGRHIALAAKKCLFKLFFLRRRHGDLLAAERQQLREFNRRATRMNSTAALLEFSGEGATAAASRSRSLPAIRASLIIAVLMVVLVLHSVLLGQFQDAETPVSDFGLEIFERYKTYALQSFDSLTSADAVKVWVGMAGDALFVPRPPLNSAFSLYSANLYPVSGVNVTWQTFDYRPANSTWTEKSPGLIFNTKHNVLHMKDAEVSEPLPFAKTVTVSGESVTIESKDGRSIVFAPTEELGKNLQGLVSAAGFDSQLSLVQLQGFAVYREDFYSLKLVCRRVWGDSFALDFSASFIASRSLSGAFYLYVGMQVAKTALLLLLVVIEAQRLAMKIAAYNKWYAVNIQGFLSPAQLEVRRALRPEWVRRARHVVELRVLALLFVFVIEAVFWAALLPYSVAKSQFQSTLAANSTAAFEAAQTVMDRGASLTLLLNTTSFFFIASLFLYLAALPFPRRLFASLGAVVRELLPLFVIYVFLNLWLSMLFYMTEARTDAGLETFLSLRQGAVLLSQPTFLELRLLTQRSVTLVLGGLCLLMLKFVILPLMTAIIFHSYREAVAEKVVVTQGALKEKGKSLLASLERPGDEDGITAMPQALQPAQWGLAAIANDAATVNSPQMFAVWAREMARREGTELDFWLQGLMQFKQLQLNCRRLKRSLGAEEEKVNEHFAKFLGDFVRYFNVTEAALLTASRRVDNMINLTDTA